MKSPKWDRKDIINFSLSGAKAPSVVFLPSVAQTERSAIELNFTLFKKVTELLPAWLLEFLTVKAEAVKSAESIKNKEEEQKERCISTRYVC